jgi:hypothetical protein
MLEGMSAEPISQLGAYRKPATETAITITTATAMARGRR